MAGSSKKQQSLDESERNFRLLVEGITDYAIYMLDPEGHVTNWNKGAERIKGYKAKEIVGKHFSVFYTPEDQAAGLPATGAGNGPEGKTFPRRRLARSQGRHAFLRLRRHRSDLREAQADRLRQDHPRHHRAPERAVAICRKAKASSRCWSAASPTTRSTCSIPPASSRTGTPAASASRAIRAGEIVGQHFSRFYTPDRPGRGKARAGLEDRRGNRPLRGRRLARSQGRLVFLGERRHRSDPQRRRRTDRLCQDHPRHHRTQGSAGKTACRCSGSSPSCRSSTRSAS